MIAGLLLLGAIGAGLLASGAMLAFRVAHPPPPCPECGEAHPDPLGDCTGPLSLRGKDLGKRVRKGGVIGGET